jgi:subtilisin family serine protease
MKLRPAALLAAGVLAGPALHGAVRQPAWIGKVDPWVLQHTEDGSEAEFLVVLAEQADLAGAAALPTKRDKGRFVFERLTEVAGRTQGPVLAALASRGVEHRPYWIVNEIWARGDRATVEAMARRADVARVAANPRVPLRLPETSGSPRTPAGIEPNLLQVGVLTFWDAGFTGQGVVVGGQDTGYDWDHPALINQYRGWNGSTADHNYNWHDAIHEPGSNCGPDSPEPCDDNSHGTHTMGTMVGDDGGTHRIGMAPGAKWIGCRNMNEGVGTPATYTECFQWFIAPTDLANQNPDPDLAPHVINNSWGCPDFEGCTDPNELKAVVEATRAAGIEVVVSAGNEGSGCETVNTPAAIYQASFTVGSVNSIDNVSSFSSRGPVTADGSERRKPDVMAPGEGICSSIPGGGYSCGFSGTSMAGPHVAGLVALNISAESCLAGNVFALEAHIEATTLQRTTGQNCGDIPGSEVPNNTYGWGVIRAALPTPDLCLALFSDGFESGGTGEWSQTVP